MPSLKNIPDITPENAHQTAIVLADENLLIPLMTSLPEDMTDINITMGYPLRLTSLYLLVKQLLDLQLNSKIGNGVVLFSYNDVMRILKNSLIREIEPGSVEALTEEIIEKNMLWIPSARFEQSETLSYIFRKQNSSEMIPEYLKMVLSMINSGENPASKIINEFIYRVILSLNRLDAVVNSSEINLTTATWVRILDRLLCVQSVPFSGEPLSGIQIMGILETRTLDFKNLIILSLNEGVLPAITAS